MPCATSVQGVGRRPFPLISTTIVDRVHEFHLTGIAYEAYVHEESSFIVWGLHLQRHYAIYIKKIVYVLLMIVVFAFSPWFLLQWPTASAGDDLLNFTSMIASCLEFLIGCFVAIVAFLFVVNQELPKTPDMHRLDKYIVACLLSVVLVGAETMCGQLI